MGSSLASRRNLLAFFVLLCSTISTKSFIPSTKSLPSLLQRHSSTKTVGPLHAASTGNPYRREKILNRDGDHFKLDRFNGIVEFGSTADLVTKLEERVNTDTISRWLADERRVALSIWDEKLLEELGKSTYRLQLMTLKFVTIQLAPSVDVLMWTDHEEDELTMTTTTDDPLPVFRLESIAFEPNVKILPGVGVSAKTLGIQIDVVGELRVSEDGKGVSGRIGFVSSGKLAAPLRLLPESALKSASRLINREVANFAIRSFQKGTRRQYRQFRLAERRQ